MKTLNVFTDFHTSELIHKDRVYLHKNVCSFDKIKLQEYVFTIIKNNLYKYLVKLDLTLPNNTSVRNLRQSNLLSALTNHHYNIDDYSIYNIGSFMIQPFVTYTLKEKSKLYRVKKYIIFILIEDYTGNIIINHKIFSNNLRGTIFIVPYSFIFNVAFETKSMSKILVTYISENIETPIKS